jgi:predicted GNAT family N-acyltransferase
MTDLTIIEPATDEELDAYYRIRYEVLRKPWNQPPFKTKDDKEDSSLHFLVKTIDGKYIACGRLQLNSATEGQLRSMAVTENYRGQGIGNFIIAHIEKIAHERKLKRIVLDARENAVRFYERNGYKITKPSYLLFDLIQHYEMEKFL